MKKYAKIITLVLTLALLVGTMLCINVSAADEAETGKILAQSVIYGEKTYIQFAVKAESAADVTVTYKWEGDETVYTAPEYTESSYEGAVVFVTDGVALYELGKKVTATVTVGGEVVDTKSYSVAEFLYRQLYNNGVTGDQKAFYESYLECGANAQKFIAKESENLVTSSTIVSTENANVTINGGKYVFAPGANLEVTPVWAGEGDVEGWKIINNDEEETVGLTFTCSGVVKIVEPVFHVHTYGDATYEWAADNFTCTATNVCTEDASHVIEETAGLSSITLNVADGKVGYTYNVAFANADLGVASKFVEEVDAPTADGRLVTVDAPAIAGRTASHEYVKFDVEDEKADTFTIYYSEVDVWDGTSVSESLSGSGTQEDPYLVQSGADLAYIAKVVNDAAANTANFKGMYFKMTKSIDLDGNSLKIGSYSASKVFHGFFDGNNCVVKGINANQSLFGMLKDGYIKNLSTYGTVTTTEKKGVAGLVSYMNGATVENITNYVNVTGVQQVAGVVGWLENNTATIANNCVNYGNIVATSYQIGGIAGFAKGTITNCTNFGDVTSSASGYVGGVGGAAKDANGARTNCVNYGNISAVSYIGGCFGQITKTTTDCYSYGTVKLVSGSATTIGDVVGSGASNLVYTAE